jgi:hypothetical protein
MMSGHIGNISLTTSARNCCEWWFRTTVLLRVQRSPASCSRANKREREGVMVSGRVMWLV